MHTLVLILAYLFGSIPFGIVVSKTFGHGDLRNFGSKNIGATNAVRKMGLKLGALVFALDALKGVLAVFIARIFLHDYVYEMLAAGAAVLGHIFPIWLKFRGGKGVATALASIVFLSPVVGIFTVITWLLTFMVFKISGLAAVVSFATLPVITHYITHDVRLVCFVTLASAIIILKHSSNIRSIVAMLLSNDKHNHKS